MNISRDLALSIFGLNEGYSEKELSEAYRRLAKITHPDGGGDNNLFILIKECKDLLENNSQKAYNSTNSERKKSKSDANDVKITDISLDLLYDDYFWLDKYKKSFNIRNIYAYAKLFVHPVFKKSLQKECNITLLSSFNDFINYNGKLVSFKETIHLPKEFQKYNLFKVILMIEDKKYIFFVTKDTLKTLTSKHAFKKDCYSDYFLTILNLSFKLN